MTLLEAANKLRETAQRMPMGAEVRVKYSAPLSAYNLAMHFVRVIEALDAGHEVYALLCDDDPAQGAKP